MSLLMFVSGFLNGEEKEEAEKTKAYGPLTCLSGLGRRHQVWFFKYICWGFFLVLAFLKFNYA